TDGGSSLVGLAPMDSGFAPASEVLTGQPGDVYQFTDPAAIPPATTFTINIATLDLNGLNPVIQGLNGNGVVSDSKSGTSTLTVGIGNGSGSFAGVIKNGTGTVGLTKIGTGTQTLIGASTYGGTTLISAGTLQVGGNNAIPSTSDVNLAGGATLDL